MYLHICSSFFLRLFELDTCRFKQHFPVLVLLDDWQDDLRILLVVSWGLLTKGRFVFKGTAIRSLIAILRIQIRRIRPQFSLLSYVQMKRWHSTIIFWVVKRNTMVLTFTTGLDGSLTFTLTKKSNRTTFVNSIGPGCNERVIHCSVLFVEFVVGEVAKITTVSLQKRSLCL